MASYLTLALVKKHLNIDANYPDDDVYLKHLIGVAQDVLERSIHQYLSDLADDDGELPAGVLQAMLIYIGDLYANRESIAFGATPTEVPRTYEYLCALYRRFDNTEDEI